MAQSLSDLIIGSTGSETSSPTPHWSAPYLEKTDAGVYALKDFDARGRYLGLVDQGLSEKEAMGQMASELSALPHPETGGPLFDYEGALASGGTTGDILNLLTGTTAKEDMPFWSWTPYKRGAAQGAAQALGFGGGQTAGYLATKTGLQAFTPKFVGGHPYAALGISALASILPAIYAGAKAEAGAESLLPDDPIAIEDYASYEAGKTAGFFLFNIPTLFTSAVAFKNLPYLAPTVVAKNADEVAGLLPSADTVRGGFSFLNLGKLADSIAEKSPFLKGAIDRAVQIGQNAKGRFLTAKELLAIGLTGGLKVTGETILKNPAKFATGEAVLATTYYPGAAYVAEKAAPGDPVIKALAETTAVIYNPMSTFTNTVLPAARSVMQVGRPGAQRQAAADHLISIFERLQEKAGMPDVTPEAFLKELSESRLFDDAGALIESGLTPAQLTANPAMQLLETYIARQRETFSIAQKDAARSGMTQLLTLIEAMANTGDISALRLAAQMENHNLRQLFTQMLDTNIKAASNKINRVVDRGAVGEEAALKASELMRGTLDDSLNSFRIMEKNLWESVPKNIPAQAVYTGAAWNRLMAELEGVGKDADVRRRLESDTVEIDIQKMRTPEAIEIETLEKELTGLKGSRDKAEVRYKDLAAYGGEADVLVDALDNYVKMRRDLPTMDARYRQAEIDFRVPLSNEDAIRAVTSDNKELDPKYRNRLPALALAQRRYDEALDRISTIEERILELRDKNIPEYGTTTFGELLSLRSKMLELGRLKGGGQQPPRNLLRHYKELANAALKDLHLAGGYTPDGRLLLGQEQLANLDPKAIEGLNAIKTATTFSRIGNDSFSRGIGGNLGIQKITGEDRVPTSETMATLFRGSSSRVWTNHQQMREALSIIEAAESMPFVASRFGDELGPPRPLVEETLEPGSLEPVQTDVSLPQLRERAAANRATMDDAYSLIIKKLINENVIKKERVLNPAASEELPDLAREFEVYHVDKDALEVFSNKYGRIMDDVPQLQQVVDDLTASPERADLLLRSWETNAQAGKIPIGTYWERVREEKAFAKVLGNTNPTMLIAEFVSAGNKGNARKDMEGLFKLAKDHGAEESVRNAVLQYALDGSRLKNGWDASQLRRILYTDPFDGIKNSPPLMKLLENKEITTPQFSQRLDKLITHLERIETASVRGEALKGLLERGYSLEFAARFLGAATASELQAAVGIGKGAIQIPGAGARMATQMFQHMPNAYILDVLTQAVSPGKENEELLRTLIGQGRPGRAKAHMRGIKAAPNALARWLGRIAGTAVIRPGIFFRGAYDPEPEMEEPVSAVTTPLEPVAEASPQRALLPRPDFSTQPRIAMPTPPPQQPPGAALTPPPQQPQGAAPSPGQRSRFAAMFPGDITSGLIRQQDVARGIGSLG
jgi:hypothetical protein